MNYTVPKKQSQDGNIAIKSNYCDGGKNLTGIGYYGVCSDEIIDFNINQAHHAWCSHSDCACSQYVHGLMTREELDASMNNCGFVCYESAMLRDWRTAIGETVARETKSFGPAIHEGAVCVLTTRMPRMKEKDRFVFALFLIDYVHKGTASESGYVVCESEFRIRLKPSETRKIKFWDYYRNKNHPEKEVWGTGLYRYMDNKAIVKLLQDLIALRSGKEKIKVERFLDEFMNRNNLPKIILDR